MRRLVHSSPRAGRAPLVAAIVLALLALSLGLGAWLWLAGPQVDEVAPLAAPSPQRPDDSEQLASLEGDAPAEEGAGSSLRQELEATPDGTAVSLEWSGTVTDASSGAAVVGAHATLSLGEREADSVTGEDGRFTIAWPVDLAAALSLEHPAYVDVRAPEVDLSHEGAFALHRSSALHGRVEPPPDGEGARALAWLEAASSERYWEAVEAPVGRDGSFEMADLDPGDYVVGAIVPGRSVAPQAGLHLERGATLEVVLRAEPAAQVTGVVLRMPQARGVPAARVSATPLTSGLPREWARAVSVEAPSDDRGRYVLEGLAPGRWRVAVETAWGGQVSRDLDVPESGERLELDLEVPGPARLTGRVSDAAGRGVEGARVLAVTDRRLGDLERLAAGDVSDAPTTTSGPSGAFALDEVPAQDRLAVAAVALPAGGDGPPRLGVAPLPRLEAGEVRGGIEVVLTESLSLSGRVLGSQGEAVAQATVDVGGRPGGLRASLGRTTSDAEGRFTLSGLPAGTIFLVAEHPDWLRNWLQVDPAAVEGEVEIRLEPAFVVEGLALDTQGFAVANVPIGFSSSEEAGQEGGRRSRGPRFRTVTDAYGRFRMEGLTEGRWVVSGSSYEWEQVESLPGVVATPGDGFVTLTFAPRDRPLRAEIRGELALADGGTPTGVRVEGLRGGVLTIDGGRFRATGVTPTRHRLTLRADGHASIQTEAIDLPPGQVHDLGRIVLEPAAVLIVRVRDEQGGALDGARVRLAPLPRSEGGAGEQGRAVGLRGRGRGRYITSDATLHAWRLVVDRQGFRRKVTRIELDSRDRVELEVRLQRASGG